MSEKPNVKDFDIKAYLEDRRIRFDESGKNVSHGWVGIKCLWCDDPSNHLGINLESKGIGCHRCPDANGTVIKLIMKIERCSYDMALTILRNFSVIRSTHIKTHKNVKTSKFERLRRHSNAASFLSRYKFSEEMLEVHRRYLEEVREFDPPHIREKYKILFGGPVGKYALRIIVPVYVQGRTLTFTARDATQRSPMPYLHCPNNEALIDIKQTLYNYDNATGPDVIVVEGAFDVWRIGNDCVGTWGTKYTTAQVYLLSKYRRVFVLYDSGQTAQKHAKALCDDLNTLVPEVRRLQLPHGDPAELSESDVKDLRKQVFGRFF